MVETMRIALIGQSAFGEAVLRALAENGADDIVGVICPPDREGRPVDPIKSAAGELKVDVFQPRRMRSKKAVEEFKSLDVDLCVMAFVTDFVPSRILEAPRHGTPFSTTLRCCQSTAVQVRSTGPLFLARRKRV